MRLPGGFNAASTVEVLAGRLRVSSAAGTVWTPRRRIHAYHDARMRHHRFLGSLALSLLSTPQWSFGSVPLSAVPEDVKAVMGWGDTYANVFGASIVARGVSTHKVQHAANILAAYLDGDGDGACDDPKVCDALVKNTAMLVMFDSPDLADEFYESGEMMWWVWCGVGGFHHRRPRPTRSRPSSPFCSCCRIDCARQPVPVTIVAVSPATVVVSVADSPSPTQVRLEYDAERGTLDSRSVRRRGAP